MPSIGKALLIFADGSRMLAELAREPSPTDTVVILHKPLGVPKPPAAQQGQEPSLPGFETMAMQVDVLRTAGSQQEVYISMHHVLAVKLLDEGTQFGPSSADMEELFK